MTSKISNEVWTDFDKSVSRAANNFSILPEQCHLGHLLLHCMSEDPDSVLQIDAATGQQETAGSVLARSTRLAHCMSRSGLHVGDVVAIASSNHLDICVPFYACHYNGFPVMGLDTALQVDEFKNFFHIAKPKMVFCQNMNKDRVIKALSAACLTATVTTFEESDIDIEKFEQKYIDPDLDLQAFRPAVFDVSETLAWLTCTSGTTGRSKVAAISHESQLIAIPHFWSIGTRFSFSSYVQQSPLQWISGLLLYMTAPIWKVTMILDSRPSTAEDTIRTLENYKPSIMIFSPPKLAEILNHKNADVLKILQTVMVGGSAVSKEMLIKTMEVFKGELTNLYAMTETLGPVFVPSEDMPLGSYGKADNSIYQDRIVDPTTKKLITEPFVNGELQVRGSKLFKGYYNNPDETAKAYTDDGWFQTGDIFYKDENGFYFFVDRLKLLLKYKSYQISPVELEEVITRHEGVLSVGVTGIPEPECGELPVAVVVRRTPHSVTAQDIKHLVKAQLANSKQLRGGVAFVEELPLTPTGKLSRPKIRELAMTSLRE